MIDKTIEVERMEHVISVFGSFDQNLRIIENELSVKVLDRDTYLRRGGERHARRKGHQRSSHPCREG